MLLSGDGGSGDPLSSWWTDDDDRGGVDIDETTVTRRVCMSFVCRSFVFFYQTVTSYFAEQKLLNSLNLSMLVTFKL